MSVEVTIVCDGCGTVMAAAKTAAKARDDLRGAGGRLNQPGGKDYCPDCAPR